MANKFASLTDGRELGLVPALFGIEYAMIFFLLLSFVLMLPQYFRVEKTRRQKLKALTFLLTSTWPQYRGSRLLWWSFVNKNDEKCQAEKTDYEQEISHIGEFKRFQIKNNFWETFFNTFYACVFAECFVESIPQTHLSWILMIMVSGTAPGDRGLVKLSGDSAGKIALFYLSFTTSVISASLGMSRLLLNGPSKFIRKTGRLGGYCQWGFVLLILSIMSGIVSKAAWLEIVVNDPFNMGPLGVVMWIGVSLLPQRTSYSIYGSNLSFQN